MTLHALGAAIPHALLLLHALLDVLPFPSGPGGMWYEIVTDSVECVDEVEAEDEDEFAALGAVEDATALRTRTKASVRIDLHVAPRGNSVHPPPAKRKATTRPSARKRKAKKHAGEAQGDEEDMMNGCKSGASLRRDVDGINRIQNTCMITRGYLDTSIISNVQQ